MKTQLNHVHSVHHVLVSLVILYIYFSKVTLTLNDDDETDVMEINLSYDYRGSQFTVSEVQGWW